MQLKDHHRRTLNYLRLSLTDRCNLRCLYCVPCGETAKLKHEEILSYEEILRLARIAVDLGITKIRLTGGEPLIRKGVCEFIPRLTSLPGLNEVTLTTNGILLKERLEKIKAGGITRLNVSMDSLKSERYRSITGMDALARVKSSIETAREMGFHPIKLNMVVMEGLNDDEILDFARLSLQKPYHIRFIEYMPVGGKSVAKQLRYIPTAVLKSRLRELGQLIPVIDGNLDAGPSERYRIDGALGEIGFISPLSRHFCALCNRLRLTASGHLRPCLLSGLELDIKGAMRKGASDQQLAKIFLEAAERKPSAHRFLAGDTHALSGQMSSIGG
jgi:cyclic pyranopterin phosphate synthase